MGSITVTDREGQSHQLANESGMSLMEVIRNAGLPLAAVCGGGLSCATCHVYVDPWPSWLHPPGPGESVLLESASAFDPRRSRLACQIAMGADADGLCVTLAPED